MNNRGQTGTGGFSSVTAPLPIPNLSFVTQVSAGGRFSLALQAGGKVYAWGFNGHGQLGNEGAIGTGTPTAIENLGGVKAVAAGGNHSLALLNDGTVKAWGDDESGQLGDDKIDRQRSARGRQRPQRRESRSRPAKNTASRCSRTAP